MNLPSDRELNRMAWDRVQSFYPRVRDAIYAREPGLDKRLARKRALKITQDSFHDVRDMMRRGESGLPTAIAEIVNVRVDDDTWML